MTEQAFRVDVRGPGRVDVQFSGKLDSDAMRRAIAELRRKTAGIEGGRMLFRVGEYRLPTLGAIAVELCHCVELLGMIRRFERVAVIAGQNWIRAASRIEGALFPGLQIRPFDVSEAQAAEAWLAD